VPQGNSAPKDVPARAPAKPLPPPRAPSFDAVTYRPTTAPPVARPVSTVAPLSADDILGALDPLPEPTDPQPK
jgi:hypothetical protein